MNRATRASRRRARRGQALVEFAIIALSLTFLFAAILSMGQMFFAAQVVQQAADVGAQELARMPLNPTKYTLNQVLYSNDSTVTDDAAVQAVRTQIFNEQYLYAEVPAGTTLYSYATANNWPLINRLLIPLMFYDANLTGSGSGTSVYRYPGTLVSGPHGLTVRVLIAENGGYAWHGVVEEIGSHGDPTDATFTGSYSLTASPALANPGTVQLRINYPYQSAGLIAYDKSVTGANQPILADDNSLAIGNPPTNYTVVGTSGFGPYAGDHNLGAMVAWGSAAPNGVRPFRRVVSGQGVYRREVFGP